VEFVDGREAALACPETFVPVDASIIGFVEEAFANGKFVGREPAPVGQASGAGAPSAAKGGAR
jgi:hypothetical protein